MSLAKIRLYVDHPLGPGQSLPLEDGQAHYLFGVMREGQGARVLLFNGTNGEWLAEVTEAGRRKGVLTCLEQTRPQTGSADLWLLFAPVKKARTDMIVEKAVELGAARLLPVSTDYTNSERLRRDKAEAHVREAAEQCGALTLPEVADMAPLARLLAGWPPEAPALEIRGSPAVYCRTFRFRRLEKLRGALCGGSRQLWSRL